MTDSAADAPPSESPPAPAPPPKKRGDLAPRLLVAAIAVPILFVIAFRCPNWSIWLLFSVAAAIGTQEWVSMCLGKIGVVGAVAIGGTFALISAGYWGTAASVYGTAACAMLLTVIAAVWIGDVANAARRITGAVSGMFYCSILFGGLIALVATPGEARFEVGADQAGWMLLPMIIIWAGDTGAYFAGRALGRHKLAPSLSPNKTWEGAIGGALSSVAGGFIAKATLLPHLEVWHVLLLALPAAVLGQVGDLAESALKRSTGVKDSGRILYGHGGMLDRVDALIFAAPYLAMVKVLADL